MRGEWGLSVLAAFVTGGVLLVAPICAFAQAWLPGKGEATLSVGYQYNLTKDHISTDGDRFDLGRIRLNTLSAGLTYGVTDRLAVTVGLPYVFSKYTGADQHQQPLLDGLNSIARGPGGQAIFFPPTIDDGSDHGTFQDFRLEVRYMATQGSLVVTPSVALNAPTSYESFGHSAPGLGLRDLRLGVNVGRMFDPVYVQARYAFAWREKVLGLRFNRSYADLELGYFVSPALALRLVGFWQLSHGGLQDEDFPPDSHTAASFQEWMLTFEGEQILGRPAVQVGLNHDPLELASFFNAGAGVSFTATPSLDVYALVFKTISGKGGHATNLGIVAGTSVSFSAFRKKPQQPSPALGQAIR